MKNPIIYILAIFALLALSSCSDEPFESAPLEAKTAAEAGLEAYKILAVTDYADHGFASVNELQSSTLGEGISVHYMHIPQLNLHDITTHPEDIIEDGDEFMFNIIANGSVKASITVHNFNGTWEVTEMGNEDVSRSIAAAKDKHQSENDLEHDAYRVVRIPGMYHYWVSFKEKGRNHFIHVYDRAEHGHVKHSVQSAKEVIADIIQTVKDFKSAIEEL
jgi:hypothetical protein